MNNVCAVRVRTGPFCSPISEKDVFHAAKQLHVSLMNKQAAPWKKGFLRHMRTDKIRLFVYAEKTLFLVTRSNVFFFVFFFICFVSQYFFLLVLFHNTYCLI